MTSSPSLRKVVFLLMVLLVITPAVVTEGVPGVPLTMVRLFMLLLGFL